LEFNSMKIIRAAGRLSTENINARPSKNCLRAVIDPVLVKRQGTTLITPSFKAMPFAVVYQRLLFLVGSFGFASSQRDFVTRGTSMTRFRFLSAGFGPERQSR